MLASLLLMPIRILSFVSVLSFVWGAAGCSSGASQPLVVGPILLPGAMSARATPVTVAPVRSARASPVEVEVADPKAREEFLAHLGEAALPLSDRPVSRVQLLALENTAQGEARGMSALGGIRSVSLAEGERASTPVTVPVGGCVSFVAQGGLGVIEVDLFLTVGEGSSMRILAEDPEDGPIAVIGGRRGCFRNDEGAPLEGELHVRMRRGEGVVALQEYSM